MNRVGIGEFEEEQCDNDFEAEGSSINKVSVEEVGIVFGGVTIKLEYVEYIVVLPMGVSADG